jgi:hypothetical protein
VPHGGIVDDLNWNQLYEKVNPSSAPGLWGFEEDTH